MSGLVLAILFPSGRSFSSSSSFPVAKLSTPELWFSDLPSYIKSHTLWGIVRKYRDGTVLVRNQNKWLLRVSGDYWRMLCFQYYGEWETFYVIDKDRLIGTTILDVGAGCGETAAFYFEKGAKKVICVERDQKCLRLLDFNKLLNEWNVEILQGAFDTTVLGRREIQFANFDCEGCEESPMDQALAIRFLHPILLGISVLYLLGPDNFLRAFSYFSSYEVEGVLAWLCVRTCD